MKYKSRTNKGVFLQTLLEMNESRRSKKLSPFEILRNETVEFVDGLVR